MRIGHGWSEFEQGGMGTRSAPMDEAAHRTSAQRTQRGRSARSKWAAFAGWAGVCALLALHAGPIGAAPSGADRIVAIGDVHGDLEALVLILQRAGLIDQQRRWSGGAATLVQVGDFTDRGPQVRAVMDLLMALEKQAPKSRGRVVVLLGNHEVMNLIGDLRYVAAEDYADYAHKDSERRLQKAYAELVELRRRRVQTLGPEVAPAALESEQAPAEWLQSHPIGYLEQREAFGPKGQYGRWLRQLKTVVQLDGVVFLHGGLSSDLEGWKLEDINQRIANELRAFDRFQEYFVERGLALPFMDLEQLGAAVAQELRALEPAADAGEEAAAASASDGADRHQQILREFQQRGSWLSSHPNGPLWYRGFALDEEPLLEPIVDRLLEAYDATAFVVGHTVQPGGRIHTRLGGKLFLIDTGMLSSYYEGGQAAALEIRGGKFTAVYADRRVLLFDPSAPRPSARRDPPAWGVHGTAGPDEPLVLEPPDPARIWIGPDGKPLPFRNEDEILQFLLKAEVIAMREIGVGITHPRQVVLEQNGIRARAIFRDVEDHRNVARMDRGRTELFFRDSYIFECAAYELSRLLQMHCVPPTVPRRIDHKPGSLQLWLEGAMMETDRFRQGLTPPDHLRWRQQVRMMRIFDNLVYNTDRNMGNLLLDGDWNLWLIDHTRAFRRHGKLISPDGITQCDRAFLERLRAIDERTLRTRLDPYLTDFELDALCERRSELLEYIDALVEQQGAERVLFQLGAAEPLLEAGREAKPAAAAPP